jgi:hypothetical protein
MGSKNEESEMKCENLNPAKKNTKVTVNGHCYQVGPGGFIINEDGSARDVLQEDAAKLTQGKAWIELSWDPEDPANAGKLVMPADRKPGAPVGRPVRTIDEIQWAKGVRPEIKPKTAAEVGGQAISVATKDGSTPVDAKVEARPPTDAELAKSLAVDDAKAEIDAKRQGYAPPTGLLADSGLEIPAAASTQEIEASTSAPTPAPAPVSAEADGVWPDPTPDMKIGYLKQMAAAYEVKHAKNVTKKTLIKKIMKEMYEEE